MCKVLSSSLGGEAWLKEGDDIVICQFIEKLCLRRLMANHSNYGSDVISEVMDAPTNHVPAEENLRDPIEIRVDIFHPTLVMAAPTNHVPAEENLRDPIEIRVDIFHPTLVAVVDFPTATVMRTLARHANVIRSI
nr:hypothetical protein [Tanacetum cinerariifolium]